MIPEPKPKLKLQIFKKLYKSLKTPFPPINFLILGMLIGIEQRYIEIVTKQTVDTAIKDYLDEVEDKSYPPEIVKHEDGSISIGDMRDD